MTAPQPTLEERVRQALSRAATARGYRLREERGPLADAAIAEVMAWVDEQQSEHRHWFVIHRHGPWPRHKPRPDRWHAHVWWRHTHA